ncbi:MAG: rRNA maturation RNase YbeY [Gemmatimonadota bacterium]|nr:MAG: rRNA maturation RNase YbeY [Gemmatimonadota bacterium]
MPQTTRDIRVEFVTSAPLSEAEVRTAVGLVLDGEQVESADISMAFLAGQRMRALNRRTFGLDCSTDVIAFGLPHPGRIVGDVYVCPSTAQRTAKELGISEQEEVIRLIIHGLLHVLGYDHPEGRDRKVSTMWRLQERYVLEFVRGGDE